MASGNNRLIKIFTMNNSRIEWIDSIRGIAIILVVMGHLSYSQYNIHLKNVIYSFHMPMFFLLAGCTAEFSMRKINDICAFLKGKFLALFIPYAVWNFLPLPYSRIDVFTNYDFWERFVIFISGRCNHGGMFWFLFTLLALQFLFAFYTWIEKKSVSPIVRAFFIILVFAFLCIGKQLWSNDGDGFGLVCQMYLFYIPFVTGICIIKYESFKNFLLSKWMVSIFVILTLYILNTRVNIPNSNTIARITGIGFTCILILLIEKGQIPYYNFVKKHLSSIGKYSLVIYLFHYTFVSGIFIQFSNTLEKAAPVVIFCVYLPLSILICIFSILTSKIIESSSILSFALLGKTSPKVRQ